LPDFKRALATGRLKSFDSLRKVEQLALLYNLLPKVPAYTYLAWRDLPLYVQEELALLIRERGELSCIIKMLPSLYGMRELTDSKARELAKF